RAGCEGAEDQQYKEPQNGERKRLKISEVREHGRRDWYALQLVVLSAPDHKDQCSGDCHNRVSDLRDYALDQEYQSLDPVKGSGGDSGVRGDRVAVKAVYDSVDSAEHSPDCNDGAADYFSAGAA